MIGVFYYPKQNPETVAVIGVFVFTLNRNEENKAIEY